MRTILASVLSACLVATLCTTVAPSAANAQQPAKQAAAFPDGTWQGVTTAADGTIAKGQAFGATQAEISFEMTVVDGEVVDGGMKVTGVTASNVPGATGRMDISGAFDLSGTAERVVFEGMMEMHGSITAGGLTVPINNTAPGNGAFSPTTATCSKATGDLAFEGRGLQQSAGVATTVVAPFVALRVKGVDATNLLGRFDALASEIEAFLAKAATEDIVVLADELFALVEKAMALLNSVAKLRSCGGVPRGFEEGLADAHFADVFYELTAALLNRASELSPQQIITILSIAYQVGVVGPSAPEDANAEQLLDQFADVLSTKVDEALAQGDIDGLIAILAVAEQLGLDDLAAKADKAVDQFLADQTSGGGK